MATKKHIHFCSVYNDHDIIENVEIFLDLFLPKLAQFINWIYFPDGFYLRRIYTVFV
jgi:hypothetical protein